MESRPASARPASRLFLALSATACLWALAAPSAAQRMTSELSGTVVDESGGVVPGASVIVTNQASGTTRRSVTNADGFFAFAALPAATYTVSVQLPGFSSYEVRDIELRAGDSRSLRQVTLRLASVSEAVSVSAEVALTPLNSGEKSATLTSEQLEQIPIVGTSAAEVLRLLPGMTPTTHGTTNRPSFTGEVYGINGNGEYQGGGNNNQSAVGNYSANGARQWALDITIDGAPGADPGCNCATSVNPNTEFVQEIKVLQANFSAEHAKGPVALTVVSKQGGRDFHGSLFGYLRDWRLNSNEWFANKIEAPRLTNRFLYPGFTVSGPLLVPGTRFNRKRDKVFFFAGFEYFAQRLETGYVKSWVPTDAMRSGDFTSAAAVGSGSHVNGLPAFPGGIVPAERIDPGGRALLNLFPMPNSDPARTGGYNYTENPMVDQDGWQALARVDVNVSDSTRLFLRYNAQRETQPFSIGFWWRLGSRQVPNPSRISGDNRSDSVTVSLTHVFDPTLTNETVFGLTYIDFANSFDEPQRVSRSALGYPYQGVFGDSPGQIPSVDAGGWGDAGPVLFCPGGFDPVLFATKWQVAVQDNLTKVAGLHTLKLGAYYERVVNDQTNNGNSNGFLQLMSWYPGSSGDTFADLLTGGPMMYDETSRNPAFHLHYDLVEAYFQDSWKLRPRLTLDLGVRASYMGPWTDSHGIGAAGWDATRYGDGSGQYPGILWTRKDAGVPLSGIEGSWLYLTPRVGAAWDVRGSGETVLRGGLGVYRYHPPMTVAATSLELGAGQRSFHAELAQLPDLEGLGGGVLPPAAQAHDMRDDGTPRGWNWTLTLDQRLPWSSSLELGYVGSRNDDLPNAGLSDINAVPPGAMLANPDGNAQDYRPLAAYGQLDVYRSTAWSNYHGLQALLSRQRGSFNVTASYTFSKALGVRTGDVGISWGSEYVLPARSHFYGVLASDRTHVANLAASWQLPGWKDRPWLDALAGGWQLGAVATYVSGPPLQSSSVPNFGMEGTNAEGTPLDGLHIAGSPNMAAFPVATCDARTEVPEGFMFNPACFAAPTAGQNGNYIWPYVRGNSYKNLDLSLFKNFSLGSKGHKLQLRVAAYNALNHPTWYPDVVNLRLVFDRGAQVNPDFGRINRDNKYGRRIVQLALRYTF